jgi:hypothetical protein
VAPLFDSTSLKSNGDTLWNPIHPRIVHSRSFSSRELTSPTRLSRRLGEKVTRFILDSRVLCSERSFQKCTFAQDCGELEAVVGWRVDTRVHAIYVGRAVPAYDSCCLRPDPYGTFQLNTRLITDRDSRK